MKRSESIARDQVGETFISTVKLNNFHPIDNVYETCIFYRDGSSDVVAQYHSEADARKGHADAVRREQISLQVNGLVNGI